MWNRTLCIKLPEFDGMTRTEVLALCRQVGFDGFFSGYGDLEVLRNKANELGMYYQSVHAPFHRAADFWRGDEAADLAVKEQIACLEDCARVEVPIVVAHVFIGFDLPEERNEVGVENYGKVCARAEELGVQIAFENTEGEGYLAAVMELSRIYPRTVGFCLDTGHELCYNRGKDMLARYGDRLIATHLNDNLGISDYSGRITWKDDLHLLPFDGIADWAGITERMCACGYDGPLTFELNIRSKGDRHDNDKYAAMSPMQYLTEAYARACRVGALFEGVRRRREGTAENAGI